MPKPFQRLDLCCLSFFFLMCDKPNVKIIIIKSMIFFTISSFVAIAFFFKCIKI